MAIDGFTRARDRLLALQRQEHLPELAEVLDEVLAGLHAVTRFSWCSLMTVDPQTLLPTTAVVEGFEPDNCAPFWDHELLAPGFNKFTALVRAKDPVATLYEATDGDLERAPIYTGLYAKLGVADELRVVFVLGTSCWGVAALVRAASDGPFPADEVDQVRALVTPIARLLKAGVTRLTSEGAGTPAIVVVGPEGEIRSITAGASALLDDLRHVGVEEPGLPIIVSVVATRARTSRTATHIATRARGTSGRWMRITAVPTDGSRDVAVMIEPARPSDLTPILLESYGFTEREAEITTFLARGLATKEIAAELSLSAHTVRDHIKAIFEKAGVNSRGELVARLFSEHLIDGFHQATHRA